MNSPDLTVLLLLGLAASASAAVNVLIEQDAHCDGTVRRQREWRARLQGEVRTILRFPVASAAIRQARTVGTPPIFSGSR